MRKQCQQCRQDYEITEKDLAFYDRVSPIIAGKKYLIPAPKMCPLCRLQLRMSFRNERTFYHRKCDLTGKEIVALYAPDSPYKVYDQDPWWSDDWDPSDYGRNFDFSRTFAEQFKELSLEVPHVSLYNINCENSYYTNYALNQKNCYLIFGAGDNEDCLYGKYIVYSKDCIDCLTIYSCELCYECVACEKCYGSKFLLNCQNCSECTMCEDLIGCKNCIACFGLRNKEYCILNRQYSKEDYQRFTKQFEYLDHEKIDDLRSRLESLKLTLPHIQSHMFGSENCSGEAVYNCKNCDYAFDTANCEDCKFIACSPKCIEVYDCIYSAPDGVRFSYNMCSVMDLENSMTLFNVWYGTNLFYCMEMRHSSYCFGCVSMKSKQYCILNKEYSKQEYEELLPKIIEHMKRTGEWGEYFPYYVSNFGYNEAVGSEYFPLDKEGALNLNANWRDEDPIIPVRDPFTAPSDIKKVGDDICQKALVCQSTSKQYRILPAELSFYRRMKLPIPRFCYDKRHIDRVAQHGAINLFENSCDRCHQSIKTPHYEPRPKVLYCEDCYREYTY